MQIQHFDSSNSERPNYIKSISGNNKDIFTEKTPFKTN